MTIQEAAKELILMLDSNRELEWNSIFGWRKVGPDMGGGLLLTLLQEGKLRYKIEDDDNHFYLECYTSKELFNSLSHTEQQEYIKTMLIDQLARKLKPMLKYETDYASSTYLNRIFTELKIVI